MNPESSVAVAPVSAVDSAPPCAGARPLWSGLALLGLGHGLVELASSYALNRTLDATDLGAGAVFAFNAVAFWGQVPLGWAADRWRGARSLALFGVLLAALVVVLAGQLSPWAGVALIALANGCYHVGGGALSIGLSRGSLGGLGLFVGPGALGLTLGVGLARMEFAATPWVVAGALALFAGVLSRMVVGDGRLDQVAAQSRPVRAETAHHGLALGRTGATVVTVALVLACIAIRSFVGGGFSFACGGGAVAALAVAAALAGGKIAGGFLADRIGWLTATTALLVLSVPALWFGRDSMAVGLLGVALFQAPMAVTLGALVQALPRRPGLAFGLASAAVYVGGLPLLGGELRWLHSFAGLSGLSIAAVLMLAAALSAKAGADSRR